MNVVGEDPEKKKKDDFQSCADHDWRDNTRNITLIWGEGRKGVWCSECEHYYFVKGRMMPAEQGVEK